MWQRERSQCMIQEMELNGMKNIIQLMAEELIHSSRLHMWNSWAEWSPYKYILKTN